MTQPPPDVTTVRGEGTDLNLALADAAAQLEVPKGWVLWSLDTSWFRNETGQSVPRDTVRVIAWARNREEMEAATDAGAWMKELLGLMGFEGDVDSGLDRSGQVVLTVKVANPGRVIGKRGVTLDAIQNLMLQSVGADHPDRSFRIEIPDKRREERSEDGGRGRGRDRDRDRDRGRGRDRDRDRGRGRDRGGRTGEEEAESLRRLARKIAKRVLRTGEPEQIRKPLNSFDRRIVHMAISRIDGVGTRSVGDGPTKNIEIRPKRSAPADDDGAADNGDNSAADNGAEVEASAPAEAAEETG